LGLLGMTSPVGSGIAPTQPPTPHTTARRVLHWLTDQLPHTPQTQAPQAEGGGADSERKGGKGLPAFSLELQNVDGLSLAAAPRGSGSSSSGRRPLLLLAAPAPAAAAARGSTGRMEDAVDSIISGFGQPLPVPRHLLQGGHGQVSRSFVDRVGVCEYVCMHGGARHRLRPDPSLH
jgi:hypothetical protein